MIRKAMMKPEDVRKTLLSFLYTCYEDKNKEMYFKNRHLSKDMGISSWILCHTCRDLEKMGVLTRHSVNPITWKTHFSELEKKM